MGFMIRSHHIAAQLVAEHQRDLRASSRPGGRLPALFARGASEPEPVPPARPASGEVPGPVPARAPIEGRPALAASGELRVRRGVSPSGVPAHVAPALEPVARVPERPVC
ncbi:MAG: hypothetical protein QOK19_1186 [Solirubrobacteraceae bacterium]|jgi:hypothetical protein|nr:hypothetical protein [Solirubrobacteraceae bacterium]